MTRTPPAPITLRRRGHVGATLVAVVLVLIAGSACSSDSSDVRNPLNGTIAPLNTGGSCTDPKGDIGGDPTRAGSLSEPAGIDLVKVDAKVTDASLTVVFETAGPIAPTPTPTFILSQGPAAQTVSFELRAEPGKDATQPWPLTLVSWKVSTKGTEEVRRPLAETATVSGATLRYEIPLKDLPPIATLIWNFGATSGGDAGLIDDCSSYDSSTATLPPDTAAGSTEPPTTVPDAKLGEGQTHQGGEEITIFEVQDPPKKPKHLDVQPDSDRKLVLVDVQFCASPDRPATAAAAHFGVKLVTNQIYPIWDQAQTTADLNYPDFPASKTLSAGECSRGWVSYSLPLDAVVGEAFYSDHPAGDDAVVWKLVAAPATTTTTR